MHGLTVAYQTAQKIVVFMRRFSVGEMREESFVGMHSPVEYLMVTYHAVHAIWWVKRVQVAAIQQWRLWLIDWVAVPQFTSIILLSLSRCSTQAAKCLIIVVLKQEVTCVLLILHLHPLLPILHPLPPILHPLPPILHPLLPILHPLLPILRPLLLQLLKPRLLQQLGHLLCQPLLPPPLQAVKRAFWMECCYYLLCALESHSWCDWWPSGKSIVIVIIIIILCR